MDTLFELPPPIPRPVRARIPTSPKASPPPQPALWGQRVATPTPSRVAPGASSRLAPPPPAPEDIPGSVAALLGFTHDSAGDTAGGFRLCLWAAVEKVLLAAGYTRHTPEYLTELHRRMTAIHHCYDCPGAATCRGWQLRKATLAVRQELLRQGRDPEQAWPLRWGVIREMFRRYRLPLPLFVHPDTSDIQTALQAGQTIAVNGLTFSPWPNAPVFLVHAEAQR